MDNDMTLRRAGALVIVLLVTMALYFLLIGDLRPAGLMLAAGVLLGLVLPRGRRGRLAGPRRG